MARSSKSEPIEKFRFKITLFDIGSFSSVKNNDSISAGFSAIEPPKANINVIEYRENNNMNRTTKQPGLVSYEPVVLRRGVTSSSGLYNWYKQVHNDVFDLNSGNKILADVNIVPVHDPNFRREMVISSLDREGKGVKHWLCVNCFPVAYKGADSFNSQEEGKVIEELTITYEAFVELKGENLTRALENAIEEADDAAIAAAANALIGAGTGAASGILGAFL